MTLPQYTTYKGLQIIDNPPSQLTPFGPPALVTDNNFKIIADLLANGGGGGGGGGSGISGVHTVAADGSDQAALLNAVYQSCGDTDTILLTPGYDSNGGYRDTFSVSSTLQWTGKNVNVIARGIEIECHGGDVNFPVVIYGAAVGGRNQACLHWDGGALVGGMIVQNVSYSRICPDNIYGTLELRTDTVSAYNDYQIVSIDGDPCVNVNLVNNEENQNQAWANKNRFCKTQMFPTGGGAVIHTENPSPIWYPGQWIFDDCDFEASSGSMFDCSHMFYAMFFNAYWEGDWTVGTLNDNSIITLIVNAEAGAPDFSMNDPRFVVFPSIGTSDTFRSADGKTVTVTNGIITSIT
jgi:hypothetical protein